jgi:hypothetical protein
MGLPTAFLRRLSAAATLACTLSGCQTLGGMTMLTNSVAVVMPTAAAEAIARDMVERLSTLAGPRDNVIALRPDGSVFGQAMASSLRQLGYAIMVDPPIDDVESVALVYVVDPFEGDLMVRVSAGKAELTRIYRPSASGAEPVSALSVMVREGAEPT